ncbi:hypothetical protein [Microbacterium marmarense]|uniref:Aminobenzoate synthetase n=1 Tax=Microbacterium marmarense TaxID=3122051 RepID=A0ABU8LUQ4_9MICO
MSSASSRSRPDALARSIQHGVEQILNAVVAVDASNPAILIDGRSGAGKSTLAEALVAQWPRAGRVQLVALDSIYPGWDGLADGVSTATEEVLRPHARGLIGVWQRWDWERSEPAEAHAVDPSLPLIVEGSGLLTEKSASLGDIRVWVESPLPSRRARALARDGELYRPHWERWARQEALHLSVDAPESLATHVVRVP